MNFIDERCPDQTHASNETKPEIAVMAAAIHAYVQQQARRQPVASSTQPVMSRWTLAARQAALRR